MDRRRTHRRLGSGGSPGRGAFFGIVSRRIGSRTTHGSGIGMTCPMEPGSSFSSMSQRAVRETAFDHARLAAALTKAAGTEMQAAKLPFDGIEFIDDSKAIRFNIGDATWKCDLTSYECSKSEEKASITEVGDDGAGDGQRRRRRGQRDDGETDGDSMNSPDGKWVALLKEHNVFIKSRGGEDEVQLSRDGADGMAYGRVSWAPDSRTLVAFRIEPGERKEVHLIESSPAGGGRAKPRSRPYALPGDKFATYELNLFDVADRKQTKPEVDRFEHEWLAPRLRWKKDGRNFTYQQADRGHQRFRVIEVDSHSGGVRHLIDEQSKTFIWTAHTENLDLRPVNWLEQSDEIIYVSESSGWRHLYLIDAATGKQKNAITAGDWVVRGIDVIDETTRQVWFRASGVIPQQDPYFVHYGRVNFDGSALVWLTAGDGNHSVQYSPDRRYLIDTFSRVDMAPVTELRRVSDGEFRLRA